VNVSPCRSAKGRRERGLQGWTRSSTGRRNKLRQYQSIELAKVKEDFKREDAEIKEVHLAAKNDAEENCKPKNVNKELDANRGRGLWPSEASWMN
jgi:hypothetical protein